MTTCDPSTTIVSIPEKDRNECPMRKGRGQELLRELLVIILVSVSFFSTTNWSDATERSVASRVSDACSVSWSVFPGLLISMRATKSASSLSKISSDSVWKSQSSGRLRVAEDLKRRFINDEPQSEKRHHAPESSIEQKWPIKGLSLEASRITSKHHVVLVNFGQRLLPGRQLYH